ncbi:MAG TPA: diacylglycerol kinase family protein [Gemmatimonadaceae bacterium]|nr:diacylglycerol kinase family protein [Gemmatimonadaceae bacterium]
MRNITMIANPTAGRGRGGRVLARVREAFKRVGVGEIHLTQRAGDEARLAERLAGDGADTIAVLGGDGTWSKVASAILGCGADCRLAMVAAGTGNDFVKSAGIPAGDFPAMAALAADGPDVRVDMPHIGTDTFLNVAGFGFDASVLAGTENSTFLRGQALYVVTALRQLFSYRGFDMGVNEEQAFGRYLMLAVANGQFFGGAFRIAPRASLQDGILDVITIRNATPARRLQIFASAMRGTHTALPEVVERRAASFTLRFPEPPIYQADGELRRATTAELEIGVRPGALRIVVSPSPNGAAPG